jgi:hypothetical protein
MCDVKSINKTIYMTYKKAVPDIVFDRWKLLNEEYKIDFSLDNDCIQFLKDNFNDYIANLFQKIPFGMFKADLWRLCKLYINGGVYADVDLVPYLDINKLDKDITFYSCLSIDNDSIFQAFMINFSKPKNPLILNFLISFLINNPYIYFNGPPYDMYHCIKYNLNTTNIIHDHKYEIEEVKINVNIGSSKNNSKHIDLHFFPKDIKYHVNLLPTDFNFKDEFTFIIKNNKLIVTRIDQDSGWGYNHWVDICIQSKESIFLFKENIGLNNNWVTSSVSLNGEKILDSRDINYYKNKGW